MTEERIQTIAGALAQAWEDGYRAGLKGRGASALSEASSSPEDIERGLRLLEARRRRNREYQRRVREDAAAMRRAREKGDG